MLSINKTDQSVRHIKTIWDIHNRMIELENQMDETIFEYGNLNPTECEILLQDISRDYYRVRGERKNQRGTNDEGLWSR